MLFASWLLAVSLLAQAPEPTGPAGRYSFASTRAVEAADLEGLSSEELQVMRNEVFARKGLRFKTPAMRAHFEKQPWYRPSSDDVTKQLTPLELANVAAIKAREEELARSRTPEDLGTALHDAASDGDVSKVKSLLVAGADADWKDDVVGDSALHIAARSGHLSVVRALLDAGAPVDTIGPADGTPLGVAAANNRLEVAKALLKAGANPDRALTCGTETALTYAKGAGHSEMVRLLVKNGAKDYGRACMAD